MALLNDVLTLAKAGYKAKEIQELLKVVEDEKNPDTELGNNSDSENPKNKIKEPEPSDKPAGKGPEQADSKEDFEDSEINIKYNDLLKKFKELQKENVNKNIEREKKSDEVIFAEAFRELF